MQISFHIFYSVGDGDIGFRGGNNGGDRAGAELAPGQGCCRACWLRRNLEDRLVAIANQVVAEVAEPVDSEEELKKTKMKVKSLFFFFWVWAW